MKNLSKVLALVLTLILVLSIFAGCAGSSNPNKTAEPTITGKVAPDDIKDIFEKTELKFTNEDKLNYAIRYRWFNAEDGFKIFTIYDKEGVLDTRLLTVPEGKKAPKNLPKDVRVVNLPLKSYLVASSPTMAILGSINSIDEVKLVTTNTKTWYIDGVQEAIDAGKMIPIGSYKAPDYETILANDPSLCVFSTMLKADVANEFDKLGVTYIRDQSAYEAEPLGRTEWVKLYGYLSGEEAQAEIVYNEQVQKMSEIKDIASNLKDNEKKKVVFMYVTSKGSIYLRLPSDYVTKMLVIAGGDFIKTTDGNAGSSSIKVEPEVFYSTVKDADVILYNYSTGGKPTTVDDLIDKRPSMNVIKDFKAYKNNQIWTTRANFYQSTVTLGDMIADFNEMLYGKEDKTDLEYVHILPKE